MIKIFLALLIFSMISSVQSSGEGGDYLESRDFQNSTEEELKQTQVKIDVAKEGVSLMADERLPSGNKEPYQDNTCGEYDIIGSGDILDYPFPNGDHKIVKSLAMFDPTVPESCNLFWGQNNSAQVGLDFAQREGLAPNAHKITAYLDQNYCQADWNNRVKNKIIHTCKNEVAKKISEIKNVNIEDRINELQSQIGQGHSDADAQYNAEIEALRSQVEPEIKTAITFAIDFSNEQDYLKNLEDPSITLDTCGPKSNCDLSCDQLSENDSELKSNFAQACRADNIAELAREVLGPCLSYQRVFQMQEERWRTEPGRITDHNGLTQCVWNGHWTLDYGACKTMSGIYIGATVGEVGMNTAHGIQDQVQQGQAQQALMQVQGGQGDLQGTAFNIQKDTMRIKGDQHTTRASLMGMKSLLMGGKLMQWPTPNNFDKHPACSGSNFACCAYTVMKYPQQLFPNHFAKQAYVQDTLMSLAKTAESIAAAIAYRKNENKVQKAQDELEKLAGDFDNQIVYGNLCEAEPDHPSCDEGRGDRIDSTLSFGDSSINLGGNGGVDLGMNGGNNFNIEDPEGRSALGGQVPDSLGSLSQKQGSKGGGEAKYGAKAQLRPGQSPAGGAMGGGAPMMGGGAGMGGGGGAPGQQPAAKRDIATGESKRGYGKGKRGAAGGAYQSGRGFQGSGSVAQNSNPFSGLFNKNKPQNRGPSSELEIADKTSSLFEQISKRYGRVAGERLIEY